MKKGTYSKLVIVSIFVLNIAFVVGMMLLLPKLSFEPSTLIASWFGFTTGEAGLTALIKIFKVKKGGNKSE